MTFDGLVVSNVLIAALSPDHEHHVESQALPRRGRGFAVAAHSLAETYCCLTRFLHDRPADEAWAALAALRQQVDLLGLTSGQQYEAIRHFAERGLAGPLLCDALTGEVARAHAIPTILTWNTRHMAGLFPDLRVLTPTQYLRRP